MSSSGEPLVTLTKGDVLRSQAQTIVNTVNCVGTMGKGVALAFKRKYPEMYRDYVTRCDKDEVEVGKPYSYQAEDHIVVNFPTKQHWRSGSRLSDIETGLQHLRAHLEEWGITSIALPRLVAGMASLTGRLWALRYTSTSARSVFLLSCMFRTRFHSTMLNSVSVTPSSHLPHHHAKFGIHQSHL
jgi:Macro domain